MMKEMEAIFGESSYIDSWMQLVRKVSWNFPGLETEENLEEHKQTVLKFMNKLQAVCVKDSENVVGVWVSQSSICFTSLNFSLSFDEVIDYG